MSKPHLYPCGVRAAWRLNRPIRKHTTGDLCPMLRCDCVWHNLLVYRYVSGPWHYACSRDTRKPGLHSEIHARRAMAARGPMDICVRASALVHLGMSVSLRGQVLSVLVDLWGSA